MLRVVDMPDWIVAALNVAGPIVLSGFVGACTGLWTYRLHAKEQLSAAVTWQWTSSPYGGETEEPFLSVQNSKEIPAYIIKASFLQGCFIKRETFKYAFAYDDITDGNFPLEIKAASVASFPLASHKAVQMIESAGRISRVFGWLGRPFIWLEIRTIGGRRLVIPANEIISSQDRPRWLKGL